MGDIPKELKEQLLQKMIKRGKEISAQAKDEISNFYLDEVEQFYNEEVFSDINGNPTNVPKVYKRHSFSSITQSGMARTFEPFEEYKKQGKKHRFIGGIYVNANRMYDDYEDDPIDVLNSFIEGYHGPSKSRNPIRGNVRPVEHTREFIEKDLSKRISD